MTHHTAHGMGPTSVRVWSTLPTTHHAALPGAKHDAEILPRKRADHKPMT